MGSYAKVEFVGSCVSPPIADAGKGALTCQQRGGYVCGNGYPAPPPPPPYVLVCFCLLWAHCLGPMACLY